MDQGEDYPSSDEEDTRPMISILSSPQPARWSTCSTPPFSFMSPQRLPTTLAVDRYVPTIPRRTAPTSCSAAMSQLLLSATIVREPTSKTGMNCFRRFRDYIGRHHFIGANESIVQNIKLFWEWCKTNTNVQSSSSLSAYMTNVKMWHLHKHQTSGSTLAFRVWPAASSNADLAKRLRDANTFFDEFSHDSDSSTSEPRTCLTPGLANILFQHLPGSCHMQEAVRDCMILTMLTGARLGELVADTKSTPHHKLLRISDVSARVSLLELNVLGKGIPPSRQLIYAQRDQVSPLVSRYGSSNWNIFTSIKRRMANRPSSAPLFVDDNNKPLTYSNVYLSIRSACDRAGIPPGAIGGHSGRIYAATWMAYKGFTTPMIMSRGRWKSDAWLTYVRLLLVYARDHGADQVTFRIGDLGIVLDKFPNLPEFSRR